MHTLLSALYAHASTAPTRPAILFQKGKRFVQLAYGDLLEETERWAARYLAAALPPQSAVAIILDHHADMFGTYLGAMRAGLIPAFLPPLPEAEPEFGGRAPARLIDALHPACVVSHGKLLEGARRATRDATIASIDVDVDGGVPLQPAGLPPLQSVESDGRRALGAWTAGAGDGERIVAFTFGEIRARIADRASALGASRNDRIASCLPLYHDTGLFTAFLSPVTLGAAVVSCDPADRRERPDSLFELARRYAATHVYESETCEPHELAAGAP